MYRVNQAPFLRFVSAHHGITNSVGLAGAVVPFRPRSTTGSVTANHGTDVHDQEDSPRPYSEIPGPKLWPIIGCLPDYVANKFMPEMYTKVWQQRYEQYGKESKIVSEKVFHRKWVNVYSPSAVKQVFSQEGKYPERIPIALTGMRLELLGYGGIVGEQGAKWQAGRSLWNRKILRTQPVEEYIPRINDVTHDFVEHLRHLAEDTPREVEGQQLMPGEVPDLLLELMKYSLEVMGTATLSKRLGAVRPGMDLELDAHRFIHENLQLWPHSNKLDMSAFQLHRYFPNKSYNAMKKAWLTMLDITSREIADYCERKKDMLASDDFSDNTAPDMLSFMLSRNVADNEILAHMQDLLLVSVDTMSNTMQMLLYCLARNTNAQEKLHKEISEVLQGREVTADSLELMRYLKCCVKESSRMYMTVPGTARVLDHDILINGYNIPKRTHINLCFQVMCHDPELFDNPSDYLPERWLDVRKGEDMAFSHLPFGFGPRSCLGRRFADQDIYIVIANLVSKFRLEDLNPKDTTPELKWFGVTLTPTEPIRIAFHRR